MKQNLADQQISSYNKLIEIMKRELKVRKARRLFLFELNKIQNDKSIYYIENEINIKQGFINELQSRL